ncbi:uncharacterized protein Bfra_010595 [Botrytis fragariae]|uniref:Uncharacterized protein n=1 Tax=Botrytis fragariae TaxID=1964551 RepID=A0A8H6AHZ6_9HELO|nr:uncharacterized protein Bfra_010595 [Botrytis fragariae]KAF5867620.1 hypothetical protein Bfra_010595 [Botrytis fragariae]
MRKSHPIDSSSIHPKSHQSQAHHGAHPNLPHPRLDPHILSRHLKPLSPSLSLCLPHPTPPQTYAAYAARYTHVYPSQSKIYSGILPPTSRHPVTPIRATFSSILLAQRSALKRIETLKATNSDPDTYYLPINAEPKFRAELNDGAGFYLDIYSSSEEVISLLHKWPFDDATKGMIPSKRLPYVDLILQFDQLNEKLHKLGQASLGYHVKYHCIPRSENRAVEVDVMAELDRYAAKLERIMKEVVEDDETEEELEELPILKTTPISKSGGKSTPTPVSKSGGKSILTPVSTPVQKPKLKLKLTSRDSRLRQNSAPKAPE